MKNGYKKWEKSQRTLFGTGLLLDNLFIWELVVQFPFLIKNYNKRPREPDRSPEKPDQINKAMITFNIYFERRKTTIFFIIRWFLFVKPWVPFTQGCFFVYLKLTQWLCRREYLDFFNVFLLFHNYLPLKKERYPTFQQIWLPSSNNALFVYN